MGRLQAGRQRAREIFCCDRRHPRTPNQPQPNDKRISRSRSMIVTTVSGARCATASPRSRVANSRSRPARGTGTVARSFRSEGKSRRELLADLALSTICVGSVGALDPTLAALAEEDLLPVKSLPKGAKASQAQEIYDLIQAAVKKNVTEDYTKIL